MTADIDACFNVVLDTFLWNHKKSSQGRCVTLQVSHCLEYLRLLSEYQVQVLATPNQLPANAHSGRQMMAPELGSLSHTWESHRKLMAPGLG